MHALSGEFDCVRCVGECACHPAYVYGMSILLCIYRPHLGSCLLQASQDRRVYVGVFIRML